MSHQRNQAQKNWHFGLPEVKAENPVAGYTMFMGSTSVYLLVLLHIAPAIVSVCHILLYKRDTRAAMGWIMACIFIPFAGPYAVDAVK